MRSVTAFNRAEALALGYLPHSLITPRTARWNRLKFKFVLWLTRGRVRLKFKIPKRPLWPVEVLEGAKGVSMTAEERAEQFRFTRQAVIGVATAEGCESFNKLPRVLNEGETFNGDPLKNHALPNDDSGA